MKSINQQAREHNIHPETVRQRLRLGWSLERALTTKPGTESASPWRKTPHCATKRAARVYEENKR